MGQGEAPPEIAASPSLIMGPATKVSMLLPVWRTGADKEQLAQGHRVSS